jgi:hypothetical protein
MRLFMVGAEGFKLIDLHLEPCVISTVLWFIFFLIWFWNVLVGSTVEVVIVYEVLYFGVILLSSK